jgi:N-acetylmuramoyl-L-alanine amidase
MLERVWIPSPNYSSRGGTAVRLIVLHTAEGARTFQDLGAYFQADVGVSSQVGIDDTPGTIGEYVRRDKKPWTQASANPYSVSAELCAFAEWGTVEWLSHPAMLENTAQWVAEEAAALGIPLERLTAYDAQHCGAGVCQHVDLGPAGGGHWDCGPSFPMDDVLEMARGGTPTLGDLGDDEMFIREPDGEVLQLIHDGPRSYWRPLPAHAASLLPTERLIDDDGSLRALWQVGAPG